MESREELRRCVDLAIAELESVLDVCTERNAEIRCGEHSRTIASIANHLADWLGLIAETLAESPPGGQLVTSDVIDEIDAAFAKASAGRSWRETRRRLSESAASLRQAISILPLGDPGDLRRWAIKRVQAHSAEIRAGLLAASPTPQPTLTQEGLR